ncbi:hypothetical protein MXB_855 [Myxobolus squamalis]|nr:hypothetical protein MXB_855 [Myxobolus squamalis]
MTILMTFLTFIINIVNAGFMYILEISLNPVSLFIGINVEFLSHIGRAFTSIKSNSRAKKAEIALIQTGSAVFKGITMTKIIGITVLAFSNSLFFKMYICAILVGSFHGIILLPIILSYIGPISTYNTQDLITSSSDSSQR